MQIQIHTLSLLMSHNVFQFKLEWLDMFVFFFTEHGVVVEAEDWKRVNYVRSKHTDVKSLMHLELPMFSTTEHV